MSLVDLLFVLAIKFFVFDFSHTKRIRNWVLSSNNTILNKLFRCPFCQGFWCGLITHIIMYDSSVVNHLYFGFAAAILCLSWNVVFWPLLDKYEETYEEKLKDDN